MTTAVNYPSEWSLEIVPIHADRVSVFSGLVDEIFVTMIPGTDVSASCKALEKVLNSGFQPVPHITARNFESKSALERYFSSMTNLGVSKALLIAGGNGKAAGPFEDTMDLLTSDAFQKYPLKTVAIAGHPEGNPEDPKTWESLEKKWSFFKEEGIHMEIVTQWSFSPGKVDAYLSEVRERGIDAPVRVGVPGPASLKTLIKYAEVCGVSATATVIKKQGLSMGRLLVSNKPTRFVSKIENSDLFHLYPFGGLEKCAEWLAENTIVSVT
ncbi:MAG: methylenetetrahydrofolate reductase [Verrucomicrobiota bacterium]